MSENQDGVRPPDQVLHTNDQTPPPAEVPTAEDAAKGAPTQPEDLVESTASDAIPAESTGPEQGQPDGNDSLKAADVTTLENFIQFAYQKRGQGLGTFRKKLETFVGNEPEEAPNPDPVLELTKRLAGNDRLIEVPFNVLLLLEGQLRESWQKRIRELMAQALSCHAAFQSQVLQITLNEPSKTRTGAEIFELFDVVEKALSEVGSAESEQTLEPLKGRDRKTLRLNALRSLALYLNSTRAEGWGPDLRVEWFNKYLWQPEAKKQDTTNFWQLLQAAKPADNKRALAQLTKYFSEKQEEVQQNHEKELEKIESRGKSEVRIAESRFTSQQQQIEREYQAKLKDADDRTESESEKAVALTSELHEVRKQLQNSEEDVAQLKADVTNLTSEIAKLHDAIESEQKKANQASAVAANKHQELRTRIILMLENRSRLLDDAHKAALNNKNEIAASRIEQALKEFTKTTEELRDLRDTD